VTCSSTLPPAAPAHVVIFDHWTTPAMTSYLGYEQSGDGGTHHRVLPYPYLNGYLLSPHSVVNLGPEGAGLIRA
jgi:hypothetical protein